MKTPPPPPKRPKHHLSVRLSVVLVLGGVIGWLLIGPFILVVGLFLFWKNKKRASQFPGEPRFPKFVTIKVFDLLGYVGVIIGICVLGPPLLLLGMIMTAPLFTGQNVHPTVQACNNAIQGPLKILPSQIAGVEITKANWASEEHFDMATYNEIIYKATVKASRTVGIKDVELVVETDKPGLHHSSNMYIADYDVLDKHRQDGRNELGAPRDSLLPNDEIDVKLVRVAGAFDDFSIGSKISLDRLPGCPSTIQARPRGQVPGQ